MRILAILVISAAAACSPYDPDLTGAPFLCGPPEQTPRCPEGFMCMTDGSGGAEVCLSPTGVVPVDGNNLNCADDSSLEPNDTVQMAWQTPVDQTKMFPLAGLAVCPAGDKDTYAITIRAAMENLEMIVEFDTGGAMLQGSILNSGGVAIANASPITGMAGKIRAYTPNLPVGTYYAQVYGPNSGSLTTNNYKMNINVTGP